MMAVYAGIAQVFLALGPVPGGLLTESFGWSAPFRHIRHGPRDHRLLFTAGEVNR